MNLTWWRDKIENSVWKKSISIDVWIEDVVQKKTYVLKVNERKMSWDVSWSYVDDYFCYEACRHWIEPSQ